MGLLTLATKETSRDENEEDEGTAKLSTLNLQPPIQRSTFLARRRRLVMCLTNSWCFVAPKMGWGEARRGSISAAICDRGATKPQPIFGATLRAAVLLASRVVARSSQTRKGMLVARA